MLSCACRVHRQRVVSEYCKLYAYHDDSCLVRSEHKHALQHVIKSLAGGYGSLRRTFLRDMGLGGLDFVLVSCKNGCLGAGGKDDGATLVINS